MKPNGSDVKLPGASAGVATVETETASVELHGSPVVECGECAYFRPLDAAMQSSGVEFDGDGNCFAEFPGSGTVQAVHKITQRQILRFIAVRPVVKTGDVCRHWREHGNFSGDVEIAQGEALEAISDTLGEVVKYLRELAAARA